VPRPQGALSTREALTVARILRVNHAGEYGAIRIYGAQIGVAKRWFPDIVPALAEMLGHERQHCAKFFAAMPARGSRPCRIMSLWSLGGSLLGLLTALAGRQSIVAYDLRTVICIPLRKRQVQTTPRDADNMAGEEQTTEVMGALYVDSRFASRDISSVSNDILRAIATEAASLIENARLVQAEEASRRYQQELSIAASIQQRLMAVTIPEVPFARLKGRNLSCKEIGGDFFDAVNTDEGLAVVLADVSGKGVSAALLASTLQGMIYSQLSAGMPLIDIVVAANRFFTHKHIGEKYATLIIARIRRDGELEYVNCGHVPPLLVCNHEVIRPPHGNLPVGLLADATYESDHVSLHAGDRLILVTDGVTEAENARGDFFEDSRLEAVAAKSATLEDIFAAVANFCGGTPLSDDCTVVELVYSG